MNINIIIVVIIMA